MRADDGARFCERTGPPGPYFVVLALVAAAQAVALTVGVRAAARPAPSASLALGVLAGVVLPLLLMAVHATVAVIGDELRLALPPFWRRGVRLDQITSAELVEVSPLRDAGGYGLRFRGGGRVALVLRRGPAVEVHTLTGESYLVGTARPDLLLAVLNG